MALIWVNNELENGYEGDLGYLVFNQDFDRIVIVKDGYQDVINLYWPGGRMCGKCRMDYFPPETKNKLITFPRLIRSNQFYSVFLDLGAFEVFKLGVYIDRFGRTAGEAFFENEDFFPDGLPDDKITESVETYNSLAQYDGSMKFWL